MNQALKELGDYISGEAASHVTKSEAIVGELILWTTPASVVPLLTMLIPVVAALIALVAALAGYTMVKFYGVIFLGQPR